MKKLIKAVAVALTVFAALAVTGCKDSPAVYTDLTLPAPKIQAKAFPGYNCVAWEPVDGAGKLYVYRNDGKLVSSMTNSANKGGYYIDTAISNGVTYEYTAYAFVNDASIKENVIAVGADTEQTLYNQILVAKGSNTRVKATAIVPKAGTKALDLVDYDGKSAAQYKLDASKIKVENYNNKIWVSFDTKGYLAYEVVLFKGNEVEVFEKVNQYKFVTPEVAKVRDDEGDIVPAIDFYYITDDDDNPAYQNFYSVDDAYAHGFEVTGPGEYTVQVMVYANLPQNQDRYPESELITAATKIEIKGLDTSVSTANFSAQYKDEKTIRLFWTPAYTYNNEVYAPENYKVYYKDNFKSVWTAISGKTVEQAVLNEDGTQATDKKGTPITKEVWESSVKNAANETESDVEGKLYYYVDYDISAAGVSNEVENFFRVMLEKDGLYEQYKSTSVDAYVTTAEPAVISTITLMDLDGDGFTNDALIEVKAPVNSTNNAIKAELASVAYTFLPSASYTAYDSEYTNVCTIIDNRGTNVFVVKDIPDGKFLSVLATTKALDATSTTIAAGYAKETADNSPYITAIGNASSLTPSVDFADVDADKDLTSKDVYFKISGLSATQTVVNARYATAKTAALAKSMLFTALPETNNLTFSTLEDLAYAYITDVEKGLYVALYAEVAEPGELNKKIVTSSSTYAVSSEVTLSDAHKPAYDPSVSVRYVDYDLDGLENDAVIYIEPVEGTTLSAVTYAVSEDATAADILLTTDKTTALEIAEGQLAYTWIIKDVAKDNYLEVYAKAEKDVFYGYNTVYALDYSSGDLATASAADEGFNDDILADDVMWTTDDETALKIFNVALDDDGINNDAIIELYLDGSEDGKDDVLAEFGYALSPIYDEYVIFSNEYTSIEIPEMTTITEPKQIFYYYVIKDIPEDFYAIAYAKATRAATYDCQIAMTTNAASGINSGLAQPTLNLSWEKDYKLTDKKDGVYNDLRIDVELGDDDQELDGIYYVVIEKDSELQEISDIEFLLRSKELKSLTLEKNTYTQYIADIPAGATVNLFAKVSEPGYKYAISELGTATADDYDAMNPVVFYATKSAPSWTADLNVPDDPLNDLEVFTLYTAKNQKISSVTYYTDKTYAGTWQKAKRNLAGTAVTVPTAEVEKIAVNAKLNRISDNPQDWYVTTLDYDDFVNYGDYLDFAQWNDTLEIYTDPEDPDFIDVASFELSAGVEASIGLADVNKYEFKNAASTEDYAFSIKDLPSENHVCMKVVISETGKEDVVYFFYLGQAE